MGGRRLQIGWRETLAAVLAVALLLGIGAPQSALAEKDSEKKQKEKPEAKRDGDSKNSDSKKDGEARKKKKDKWQVLFDGKSMGHWEITQFGGQGDVHIEDGKLVMPFGSNMTGISWKKDDPPHRMNYELQLKAMRVDGTDFFCGLTFPVGDDPCTLIVGGWGGGVTGLSSLDGFDASQNNTSQWINYESGQWYHIRLRVTKNKIEAWLDGKKIIDADIRGKKISIRPEVELSKPLGIACWQTTSALKNIRIRPVKKAADPVPEN